MLGRVLRFNLLPMLIILIFATARFVIGIKGVPYAPRGNAMFSVVGVTILSNIYFGALSRRVGGFTWSGTLLGGVCLGLFAQILVFTFTLISYQANLTNSYYLHWDALNVPEGTVVPFAKGMVSRLQGLLIGGPVLGMIMSSLGRALSFLAPLPVKSE